MKQLIKKIAKPIAIGVFFMALFFNVKVSLENPFIRMDNAALTQTSSSSTNPYRVSWEWCTWQSIYVLKCRLQDAGELCYANWQEPCY